MAGAPRLASIAFWPQRARRGKSDRLLEHHALPYAGERDRIVVSFNAALHASEGSDRLFAYAAG